MLPGCPLSKHVCCRGSLAKPAALWHYMVRHYLAASGFVRKPAIDHASQGSRPNLLVDHAADKFPQNVLDEQ